MRLERLVDVLQSLGFLRRQTLDEFLVDQRRVPIGQRLCLGFGQSAQHGARGPSRVIGEFGGQRLRVFHSIVGGREHVPFGDEPGDVSGRHHHIKDRVLGDVGHRFGEQVPWPDL